MPARLGRSGLITWALSTLLTFYFLRWLGDINLPLTNPSAPVGILSFEFAGSVRDADAMLQAWARAGVLEVAYDSLRVDFVFLLTYPISLALSCRLVTLPAGGALARVGRWLAWAVLACAPLDAVENLALLAMLDSGAGAMLAGTAFVCAGIKFLLVFVALGFILVSVLAWLRGLVKTRPSPR